MGSPTLQVLSKACELDPDGGGELLRLTLFEALADLTERYGPRMDADFAKGQDAVKAELVRAYVSKRLAGDPVEEIVTIAKAYNPQEYRDRYGEWAKQSGADKIMAITAAAKPMLQPGGDVDHALNSKQRGGTDGRGYAQMKLAGKGLLAAGAVTTQPHIAALGATAALVGELGPEAENVLGPAMKRTAYRYRGTERRPSPTLQRETYLLAQVAPAIASEDFKVSDLEAAAKRPTRNNAPGERAQSSAAAAAIAQYYAGDAGRGMNAEQVRMAMTGDYNAEKLQHQIPSLQHARISLAAGKMPPSIGVMIDRDGDVVSEAQGFNGDHYLPFDLANLKRLQGGSYVRTRTTGGPTDEDIYTGLMTGARQLQVVSHSGVFTVEFDPNTRGSRRYSDKARQMVGRYAAIVNTIGSKDQMQRDFSPTERAKMKAEAETYGNGNYTLAADKYAELERNARARIKFEDTNAEAVDAAHGESRSITQRTIAAGGATSAQSEGRDARELTAEHQASAAKVYRLDGEGYEAAMTTLKNEFPFYIRSTRFQSWPDFYQDRNIRYPKAPLKGRQSADLGYTAHRGLTPLKAGGQRADEPVAPAAAGAATATSTTAAVASSPAAINTAGLQAELAKSLAASFPVSELDTLSQLPPLDATDATAHNGTTPGTYLRHVATKTPEQAAAWLMSPAVTAEQITKLQHGLVDARDNALEVEGGEARVARNLPPGQIDSTVALLGKVALAKDPYAAPTESPVTAAGTKPQLFPDIATLGFGDVAHYEAYLRQNPDVAGEYSAIAGQDDAQIAELVGKRASEYNTLNARGQELALDPTLAENPSGGLEVSANPEAAKVYSEGANNQRYRELENLQKAWSVKRGIQVTRINRGQDADATPKALVGKRLTSSRQVIVHPAGSPVAVAVSKRLARRSPRRGQLMRK
jgi:hypothetical protein